MTKSRQEEIIAVLWLIAALLAFIMEEKIWGWVFLVKAMSDIGIAIYFSIIEIKEIKKV